jgi:putative transposase
VLIPGVWPCSPSADRHPELLLAHAMRDVQHWTSGDELRMAIVIWIERTYHRRRRQRRLGKLTPVEFEMLFPQVPRAA